MGKRRIILIDNLQILQYTYSMPIFTFLILSQFIRILLEAGNFTFNTLSATHNLLEILHTFSVKLFSTHEKYIYVIGKNKFI